MKNFPLLLSMILLTSQFAMAAKNKNEAIATFAGGCFWCMEQPFDNVPGVLETTPGYTGGHTPNPDYATVSSGNSGHYEAIQVRYNKDNVSYEQLLQIFWRNVDPTDVNGQFCDKGPQYRSAIFFHNEQQKQQAIASKKALEKNKPFHGQIVTSVIPASTFYPAEYSHQNYYQKNPLRYKFYRFTCRRDKKLEQLWGNRSN